MDRLKAYTLSLLLSTLAIVQETQAATLPPPISEQVEQVAQWFQGFFNNSPQVQQTPTVPLITMSNCGVQLQGGSFGQGTQDLYLEQYINGSLLRSRFYLFSPDVSGVKLSVYSFASLTPVLGLCDRPVSERIVSFSNINSTSCDLLLTWQPVFYTGNNAPNGCPTMSGGKVVSDILIRDNSIYSLDQIFNASGQLIAGTPINFDRIPESSLVIGLLTVTLLGGYSLLKK